ncbi:MAG: adenosylcobalamin-dependent ribonucleoside-diphosphate reductase [Dehalococcoidia bacterium]|nr:adenosylcobalamin-dependent ribonucleoside-diphosphate reductase [Dehalococcoidia bacterium]
MTTTTYPGLSVSRDERPTLKLRRFFTNPSVSPYDSIDWEMRKAAITDESGKVFFEQTDIEIPSFWSQTATQVVASKYFRGRIGSPERESSARQMVDRIVNVIGAWGRQPADMDLATGVRSGVPYFASEDEALTFEDELRHILIHQLACFNSPVWFNVGTKEKPQCSACFILSVTDDMESILDWCRTEGMIFKGGSGSGINLSTIRSSREHLSGGGIASGPVSFMRALTPSPGRFKSGGTTRRAAKMVILNADHPDVMDFIESKAREEKKAYDLGAAGWDMSLNGEAWASVQFQNANNSIRATDDFMRAAIAGGPWELRGVIDGSVIEVVDAAGIMRELSRAAWECGDPGMQFDTTINDWHTCANTARINGSNPCSEYMHVDDSACNLSSINLLRFLKPDPDAASGAVAATFRSPGEGTGDGASVAGAGEAAGWIPPATAHPEALEGRVGSSPELIFDVEAYTHTVDIMTTAQEIIVGHSGYPTPKIEANAHAMRQLGLGYANLGALLMTLGLPYDSGAGRAYAAALTAVMTGRGYAQSANIAARVGSFSAYELNREPMLRVIGKHRDAAYKLIESAGAGGAEGGHSFSNNTSLIPDEGLAAAATAAWDEALDLGQKYGYRNAQATVLAPTGTIAFMMDCDTTGVEPDIALIKYKKLVGGGMLRIVNQTVPTALSRLGYSEDEVASIIAYIDAEGTIEGAPALRDEHLPVFDCAFRAEKGERSIRPMGHVLMMGAIQPFISGAISKTVNVPNEATVDDIVNTYIESWKAGVKAIAIYRDGSKAVQPLSTSSDKKSDVGAGGEAGRTSLSDQSALAPALPHGPVRRRLPDTRPSITHKFSIEGHEGYINVGMYEDGAPGEIFVTMAKEGSTISGMMDAFATSISLTLQYGVPLRDLVQKFSHMRFEPMGRTENRELPMAQSIVDYIFRWLASQFLSEDEKSELGILTAGERARLEARYSGVQPELVTAPVQPIVEVSPAVTNGNAAGVQVNVDVINVIPTIEAPAYRGPRVQEDAPSCASCGWIMTRSGTCYRCENCGSTSGCS